MSSVISTGIDHLDDLLNGLEVGENVVWETDSGSRHDLFVRSFVQSALADNQTVVYVSFNRSPATMEQVLSEFMGNPRFILVDCFTSGKGQNDALFNSYYEKDHPTTLSHVWRVKNPAEPDAFIHEMNRIEDECGAGPRYVIDSLTGMQDLWGDEARAYKFFTYTCPRLYDLKTIAYWLYESEAHTRSFCANLRHVTQVVIGLSRQRGLNTLQIHKAEGRSLGPQHFNQQYEVIDGEITFVDAARKQLSRVGERIRNARQAKRMSQAELARLLGLTGSTISQAENGLISLSLQHLMNLARVLEVSLAQLLDEGEHQERGGPVYRAGSRIEVFPHGSPVSGLKIEALRPDEPDVTVSAYVVDFAEGTRLGEHFFATKGPEFGYVVSGSLQVQVGKAKHEVAAGECIFLEDESPTGWRNTASGDSQIVWVCTRI
ncbi:MAG TPA: helix-turn-helix domain-containing protein [Planctomycetota bacterium]|nr:helix-turn-helix domain-containing protein [Planctomycetota bacterium]